MPELSDPLVVGLLLAYFVYLMILAGWIVLQRRPPLSTLSWLLSLAAPTIAEGLDVTVATFGIGVAVLLLTLLADLLGDEDLHVAADAGGAVRDRWQDGRLVGAGDPLSFPDAEAAVVDVRRPVTRLGGERGPGHVVACRGLDGAPLAVHQPSTPRVIDEAKLRSLQ